MNEVELDGRAAMRQAGYTAEHYLTKEYEILNEEFVDWSVRYA